MKTLDWKGFLSKHPVFACLSSDAIARLLEPEHSKQGDYARDDVIFEEGQLGDTFFLVGSGKVTIVLTAAGGREIPLATLGAGEFFGEMALIEKKPRSARAVASEACVLLEIAGTYFLEVLRKNPELEFKILYVLSDRLRHLIEYTLTVKLNDVNEKFELLNRRLDSELKVISAELKASQAVFEQTSKRANEIIISAERSRTRLTALVSAAGGVVAVFIAVAGLFGGAQLIDIQSNLREILDDAENARSLAEEASGKAQRASEEAQRASEEAERIERAGQILDEMQSQIQQFYAQVIIPRFREEIATDFAAAQETLRSVLNMEDLFLTQNLFKAIHAEITRDFGGVAITRGRREDYREILFEGINSGHARTARQRILSYYIILITLVLDQKDEEFAEAFTEFEEYLDSEYQGESIKDTLDDFAPDTYKTLIDLEHPGIFAMSGQVSESTKSRMKEKIQSVWQRIP